MNLLRKTTHSLASLALLFAAGSCCLHDDVFAQETGRYERREPRGLDSLARRVAFLEIARAAYDEAGRERNERGLANAVRYGRLMLEEADDAALADAAKGVPSIGNLIELLQGAHEILADRGKTERAMACNQLAEFYADRERERRAGAGESTGTEREPTRRGGLEDRAERMAILRLARTAHAEAGDEAAAGRMERILHLAELQHADAADEAIAEASEGLSQDLIIELVRDAHELYARWGHTERATACRRLAEFYVGRAGGDEGRNQQRPDRRSDATERQQAVRELQRRIERIQAELVEIQEMLRRLTK